MRKFLFLVIILVFVSAIQAQIPFNWSAVNWTWIGEQISQPTKTKAEKLTIEWEYIKGGQGKATLRGATFDEVWNRVQDILFFEKFKIKGQPIKATHEALSVEKDSGLVSVVGYRGSSRVWRLKVIIREKDGQMEVKTQCVSSSLWRKKVIVTFFQMLEKGLK